MFRPLCVKRGSNHVKQDGCRFACLAVRAVHIEIAHSLTTDSFRDALRNFTGLRGKQKTIFSGSGSNVAGAQRKLKESLLERNFTKIEEHLRQHDIRWEFDPPLQATWVASRKV